MSEPTWQPNTQFDEVPLVTGAQVFMGSGINPEGGFEAMIFKVEIPEATADGESITHEVVVCMSMELAAEVHAQMSLLFRAYNDHGTAAPDGP